MTFKSGYVWWEKEHFFAYTKKSSFVTNSKSSYTIYVRDELRAKRIDSLEQNSQPIMRNLQGKFRKIN